jgi:SPX domain protein involved in polyphosphate accumulation
MNGNQMQTSRIELKYVINEDLALQIRAFARRHLVLDEHSVGKPNFSYPVHSLYLDSDTLLTYWNTINGDRNRFKLRIRFYDEDAESPVFLEVKRRVNDSIKKQRAGLRRDAASRILAGQLPDPANRDPKDALAMEEFHRLMQQTQARPKLHVAYQREAYMPREDNSARLTFDRNVRSEPDPEARLTTRMRNPRITWGKAVILELKFTNRFPDCFGELVQRFELKPTGAAKYVDGLAHHSRWSFLGSRQI